jgi:hypothetical protein
MDLNQAENSSLLCSLSVVDPQLSEAISGDRQRKSHMKKLLAPSRANFSKNPLTHFGVLNKNAASMPK